MQCGKSNDTWGIVALRTFCSILGTGPQSRRVCSMSTLPYKCPVGSNGVDTMVYFFQVRQSRSHDVCELARYRKRNGFDKRQSFFLLDKTMFVNTYFISSQGIHNLQSSYLSSHSLRTSWIWSQSFLLFQPDLNLCIFYNIFSCCCSHSHFLYKSEILIILKNVLKL